MLGHPSIPRSKRTLQLHTIGLDRMMLVLGEEFDTIDGFNVRRRNTVRRVKKSIPPHLVGEWSSRASAAVHQPRHDVCDVV